MGDQDLRIKALVLAASNIVYWFVAVRVAADSTTMPMVFICSMANSKMAKSAFV